MLRKKYLLEHRDVFCLVSLDTYWKVLLSSTKSFLEEDLWIVIVVEIFVELLD